jgi:hypothetical protein
VTAVAFFVAVLLIEMTLPVSERIFRDFVASVFFTKKNI